ncbi:MAG: FkbM family methyltransferase [Mariprofundus sp.]|nr:FkbM family methyltransferase [Mariprofundus sp.]
MGYMKEKYNRSYFLKEDANGQATVVGAEGAELFKSGAEALRSIDQELLSRIDFEGQNVLEFGYGRGEAVKYALGHGAKSVVGVDFSKAAFEIANDYLSENKLDARLICDDALKFVEQEQISKSTYDIVVMLDFIEHVPRVELSELFECLKFCLNENAVVVINTPVFAVDNDVLEEGLKEEAFDSSDEYEETAGMHCNRYTKDSLVMYMKEHSFSAITPHFYSNSNIESVESSEKLWEKLIEQGFSLLKCDGEEPFEYAVPSHEKATALFVPRWHKVQAGLLQGRELYIDPNSASWQQEILDGSFDGFLFDYVSKLNLKGKIVFDVGAHVGFHSLCFSSLVADEGHVFSFEPSSYNRERMTLNFLRNKDLSSRITLLSAALSNSDGILEFSTNSCVDDGRSSGNFIDGADTPYGDDVYQSLGFYKEKVPSWKLDNIFQHIKIHGSPDLIKLDVEGAESLVLDGAMNFLKDNRPVLLIEIHSFFNYFKVVDALYRSNYRIEYLQEFEDNLWFNRIFISALPEDNGEPTAAELKEKYDSQRIELLDRAIEAVAKRDILLEESESKKNALYSTSQSNVLKSAQLIEKCQQLQDEKKKLQEGLEKLQTEHKQLQKSRSFRLSRFIRNMINSIVRK